MSLILIFIGSITVMFLGSFIFGLSCFAGSEKDTPDFDDPDEMIFVFIMAWILTAIIAAVLLSITIDMHHEIEDIKADSFKYESQQEEYTREGDYYDNLT